MIICNTHQNKKYYLLLEAVVPVFIGALIYILFRTDSLQMYRWFEYLKISGFIYSFRDSVNIFPEGYFKILINTIPNGLWAFSYSAFLLVIWKNEITSHNYYYFIFIPIIAVMSEFMQLFGIVSGTFDILDVISYAFGSILPFAIHYQKIKINIR
ncbi:MAG: hypothetical protein WC358_04420 [Ignavibacteria bacterium]|jgi:hypothetical protein